MFCKCTREAVCTRHFCPSILQIVLLYQLAIFEEKLVRHFICQGGKEFIHEYSSLTREGEYECALSLFDGLYNILCTFPGAHHLAFIHRAFTLRLSF